MRSCHVKVCIWCLEYTSQRPNIQAGVGSRSFKSTGSGQKSTARKRGPTDTTTGPAAQAKRQKNDSKPATKTSKKNIMVVGIDAGCTYSGNRNALTSSKLN